MTRCSSSYFDLLNADDLVRPLSCFDRKPVSTAVVDWVESSAGGRSALSQGCVYTAPACIDGQSQWPDCSWSLVIETLNSESFSGNDQVRIRFLVNDAPHHWLVPGVPGGRFRMYEGTRETVVGVVQGETENQ